MRVRKVAATTATITATTITTTAMINVIAKITSTAANDGRVVIIDVVVVVKLICSTLFPLQLLQRVHLLPESIAFPMYHI